MNLLEPLLAYTPYLALAIRVPFGASLMLHGYPKTQNEGLTGARGFTEKMMKVPAATANIAAILEFVGGLFLIVGFIVPIAALFYVIFFGSITIVKKTKMGGVYSGQGKPTYEIDVMYLLIAVVLLVLGAGAFSVDSVLGL
jgi:putative oxidoreductase